MAGSAHAFDQGWLELWQVLAGKPLAPGVQPNYPYRRDYIYC
jgi:cyclopropane-fatty-acyl-phospholipid synthase